MTMACALLLYMSLGLLLRDVVALIAPFPIPWSTSTFGPDGPWQAVQLSLGTPGQALALYPGNQFQSHILTTDVCTNSSLGPSCPAQKAGTFNESASSTLDDHSISLSPNPDPSNGALDIRIGNLDPGGPTPAMDTLLIYGLPGIPNGDLILHRDIYMVYPDGTPYPLSVGTFALGGAGPSINQTFSLPDAPSINASLVPGWLYANNRTPSNSFGLHIGSARLSIPGSLLFGGYDENRVVGDITTQHSVEGTNEIDLADISLTVASGGSPWNRSSITGLLASGNSSIGTSLTVGIDPLAPYLDLPQSTCDAIAAWLPVTYSSKYGLYIWNTNDPQYQRIVTSPSLLTFTFRKDQSNSANLTIAVPFSLLNLTLDTPLTSTPTPYFPCNAASRGHYSLGRAFLQAAFIGCNWAGSAGQGTWWLAQAPGPNIVAQPNVRSIGYSDESIQKGGNDWATSWQGVWKELPVTSGSPSAPSSSASAAAGGGSSAGGLSTGAKAGVGAGVGIVAVAALVAVGFCLFRRRQWRRKTEMGNGYGSSSEPVYGGASGGYNPRSSTAKYSPMEMNTLGQHRELDSGFARYSGNPVGGGSAQELP